MPLPNPGEIYWLPPEVGSHDKDEPRPHVVLSPTSQNGQIVTLGFGTSSALQAVRYFAPYTVVDESSATFKMSGLRNTTYFYPSRLVTSLVTDMPSVVEGRILDEFPDLRDAQLPRAIGLGTGSASGRAAAANSHRGKIAVFSDWFSELLDCRYGLVISWPRYSRAEQVQNVVPIYNGDDYQEVAPNFTVASGQWLHQLSGIRSALFMVELAQGAYDGGPAIAAEDRDIVQYLPIPVDDEIMRRIDEALAERLLEARVEDVLGAQASDSV